MGPFLRYCFWSDRDAFLDDLRPKYILPSLVRDGTISFSEQDDVMSERTPRMQVLKLIEILGKKGNKAFDSFVNALNEDDAYPWLANKLIEKKESHKYEGDDKEIEKMHHHLAMGGVPFQTNYLFKRESVLYDIRAELLKAADKQRWWVVLHGMIGCGKSVLAAEAVRDSFVYQKRFSNGICWVPVGNLKDRQDITLLHKLQILWDRLEATNPYLVENRNVLFMNPDTDKVKKYLTTVFAKPENKNFLIILDDVWEQSVIKAFDVGCPVMVTTKNTNVVNSVSSCCSFVGLDEGLNYEEARRFLSQFVKADPDMLPTAEIKFIHDRSKGLPLTLSLIGSMMVPYGNKLRKWQDIKKKLEKSVTQVLNRTRHLSGDSAQLKDMIDLSIDSLDDETKDHYFDFAIFEEDVFVPNKVLEVLWDEDSISVEDKVYELYQKSLLCFEEQPESDIYKYCVHDLYLEHLKDLCRDNNSLEVRHKKLVNQYLKLCRTKSGSYDFGLLPNDGYIHYYIGYHLYHANLVEHFTEIFLDFNFIQNKLHFAGSSDLLFDFQTYRPYFVEVLKEMEDIVSFIRRNAHLLCNKDADIIQLALFEPSDSTVHKKAEAASLTNNGKMYFKWSNQGMVPYLSILNTKLGFDDLRCASFNPSNDIVATVGDDNSVLLWDSTSGEEFDKLVGHTDSINCCNFNSDGTILATASVDGTVRLWDIDPTCIANKRGSKTKRGSQTFLLAELNILNLDTDPTICFCHNEEVTWCSLSSDGKLIVSGDSAGIVKVYDITSKTTKWEFSHDSNNPTPIQCCMFGFKNNIIATASGSTIKIWNIVNQSCEAVLSHNNEVIFQFCFSKRDEYIYSVSSSLPRKWNVANQKAQKFDNRSQSFTLCCCLSPSEKFLSSGTSDYSVIVWNTASLKLVANLRGHKSVVQSVAYSEDGSKLLSTSADGHVIIWDMSNFTATSMVSLQNNLSVKCSDELFIASSDHLNCIQVRSGVEGKVKHKSVADNCDITSCSLSDSCSEVVYGTKNGSVKVFIFNSGQTTALSSHSGQITYLTHLKNSLGFVSCSEDRTLRIWNEQRKYKSLKGHLQSVVMCIIYDNGQNILSCSEDGSLRVWDIQESKMMMVLEGHGNQKVNCCDVSPCEKYFCSASSDCTIKIWNAQNGQELKMLKCDDCVRCCRFSPVNDILVSGEDSGEVKMWRIKTASSVLLGSHDSWVRAITFSKDGSQFVSVADSIKLWSSDARLAQTIVLPGAFTCALWSSPDFKMFVLVHNSVLYILKSVS